MKEGRLSRRGFACRLAQVAVGGSVATQTLAWAAQSADGPVIIDLSDAQFAPLLLAGGAVKVAVEGQDLPVIVTRVNETTFAAFSSECTHWGCEVDLPDEKEIVRCPCHTSRFDIRGQLIDGEASGDLPAVAIEIRTAATAVATQSWGQIKREKR